MTFQIQPRRALYVYINHMKHTQQLKKFGQITYVSRKMMFVTLYINDENAPQLIDKLKQYKFVKKVVMSPRPEINPDLDNLHDDVFFENYDEGGNTN
ncbi:hypothetical protein GCM10025879_15520 [Leuconostoc litchii]|uniref:DUF2129 domain-containing protein n=1 Tax=Leuconostoc litchii TaxID=1981069 RepID=A0A652NE48_9LACO|nr:YlbG family protein [Leuconostoc litchii]TYC45990.1 DUF2129 domain-containing protein [Leuconostoc litchii]GMA70306.1 hypothetical protein GCM10025879_15520 [Leuconostoc litchii]